MVKMYKAEHASDGEYDGDNCSKPMYSHALDLTKSNSSSSVDMMKMEPVSPTGDRNNSASSPSQR